MRKLVFEKKGSKKVEVSFVIPVYNQAQNIKTILDSIVHCAALDYELIIIDDGSTDNTYREILHWLSLNKASHVRLYRSIFSFYETGCDDFGIRNARSNFIILTQADILLLEVGVDARMIEIFESFEDLFLLSGRGTDTFEEARVDLSKSLGSVLTFDVNLPALVTRIFRETLRPIFRKHDLEKSDFTSDGSANLANVFPNLETFRATKHAGFRGNSFFHTDNINFDLYKDVIWVGESVMRGPIALQRDKYLLLGGFDAKSFFLGFDDHDISLRAWRTFHWRTAFIAINVRTSPGDGSTRKRRTLRQNIELLLYTILKRKQALDSTLSNFKSTWKTPPIEIRERK